MNISEVLEVLPPQVYVRRGELVVHFSDVSDLVARVLETSNALSELSSGEPLRTGATRGRKPRINGEISAPSPEVSRDV